jgi:methylmalonyl-CoA/ethylmalonyl-CoA epimerase
VAELRASGVVVVAEPHLIFTHDDDLLGPAGAAERQAFIRDSEGNTIGLVSQTRARRRSPSLPSAVEAAQS